MGKEAILYIGGFTHVKKHAYVREFWCEKGKRENDKKETRPHHSQIFRVSFRLVACFSWKRWGNFSRQLQQQLLYNRTCKSDNLFEVLMSELQNKLR